MKRSPQEPIHSQKLILLRNVFQTSFGLFCLYVGYCFYRYYLWITLQSNYFVPRPPSVEAFLPISALMAAKKFLFTGHYDTVHPAGLTIFIAAITISFLLRKSFCGWICPIGFFSNLLQKLGQRTNTIKKTPQWFNLLAHTIKYLLLAFFIYIILIKMGLSSIDSFLFSQYNIISDAKMLIFFISPTTKTIIIIISLIIISSFIRNFWCRFLCPYGALLGLFSFLSPARIIRDNNNCISCKKCDKVCPSAIEISAKNKITSPECIGCLECVAHCPVDNCLNTFYLNRKIPPLTIPVLTLFLFLTFWGVANLTGHWQQNIDTQILKRHYMSIKNSK